MTNLGRMSWLYGKQFDRNDAFGGTVRPYVMSVTSVLTLMDRLEGESARDMLGSPAEVAERATIYDPATQSFIQRNKLTQLHPVALSRLEIRSPSVTIRILNGKLTIQVMGAAEPRVLEMIDIVVSTIDSTSRPRIHARRLWILAPWSAVAIPLYVIFQTPNDTAAEYGLLVATVLAAAACSGVISAKVKGHAPPSIIRPYSWVDLAGRSITVWVGVLAAAAGALATGLVTSLLPR
jgi:hypothetical protein